jgi:hypothetical protein
MHSNIYIYPITSYNRFQYFLRPLTILVRLVCRLLYRLPAGTLLLITLVPFSLYQCPSQCGYIFQYVTRAILERGSFFVFYLLLYQCILQRISLVLGSSLSLYFNTPLINGFLNVVFSKLEMLGTNIACLAVRIQFGRVRFHVG